MKICIRSDRSRARRRKGFHWLFVLSALVSATSFAPPPANPNDPEQVERFLSMLRSDSVAVEEKAWFSDMYWRFVDVDPRAALGTGVNANALQLDLALARITNEHGFGSDESVAANRAYLVLTHRGLRGSFDQLQKEKNKDFARQASISDAEGAHRKELRLAEGTPAQRATRFLAYAQRIFATKPTIPPSDNWNDDGVTYSAEILGLVQLVQREAEREPATNLFALEPKFAVQLAQELDQLPGSRHDKFNDTAPALQLKLFDLARAHSESLTEAELLDAAVALVYDVAYHSTEIRERALKSWLTVLKQRGLSPQRWVQAVSRNVENRKPMFYSRLADLAAQGFSKPLQNAAIEELQALAIRGRRQRDHTAARVLVDVERRIGRPQTYADAEAPALIPRVKDFCKNTTILMGIVGGGAAAVGGIGFGFYQLLDSMHERDRREDRKRK